MHNHVQGRGAPISRYHCLERCILRSSCEESGAQFVEESASQQWSKLLSQEAQAALVVKSSMLYLPRIDTKSSF